MSTHRISPLLGTAGTSRIHDLVFYMTQPGLLLFGASRCTRALTSFGNIISVNHPRVYLHTYLMNSFLPRSRGYVRPEESTDSAASAQVR